MSEPRSSRPYMPGYGVVGAGEGRGLLAWSWATERLTASHDYWLATVRPDGRPHVMPVWGVWHDESLWVSAGPRSRKVKNIEHEPRAVATTDDALQPVVVEGTVERVSDTPSIEAFAGLVNAKYRSDYPVTFFVENACLRLVPSTVFGLDEDDFTGTPTRWAMPGTT